MEPTRRESILKKTQSLRPPAMPAASGGALSNLKDPEFTIPARLTLEERLSAALPERSPNLRQSQFGVGNLGFSVNDAGGSPAFQLERSAGMPAGMRINTISSADKGTGYVPRFQQATLEAPSFNVGSVPVSTRLLYNANPAGVTQGVGSLGGQAVFGTPGEAQLSAKGVVSPDKQYQAGLAGFVPINKNLRVSAGADIGGRPDAPPERYNFNVNVGGEF